ALPGVPRVGPAPPGQLAGFRERDEIRADAVAALVGRDEPERRQHACDFRDQHRLHPELVRELARVQRPRPTERDESEAGGLVSPPDPHNPPPPPPPALP